MIFRKIKGLHLDGKKELTTHTKYEEFLNPKFVYFPLLPNSNAFVTVGEFVKVNEPIIKRNGAFPYFMYSSVSGRVTSIKKMWHSSGKMVDMLEIENDGKDEVFTESTLENYPCQSENDIIQIMKASGLIGLGGAGFPTYAKYTSEKEVKTLIINAAECEPYLTADYNIIMNFTSELIDGIKYMLKASKASMCFIAIKKTKKDVITALKNIIKDEDNIKIHLLKDVYPAGWERYIVESVLKKKYDSLPIEVGAIVNNVQTAFTLSKIIKNKQPFTKKFVTFSGDGLLKPCNVLVKNGTSVKEIIEFIGGYSSSELIMVAGGPLTGKTVGTDDLILTPELCAVTVLKKNHNKNNPECLGCGKCSSVCPAFLTPTEIKLAFENNDLDLLKELCANKCIQCGLCSYICPSRIEITNIVGRAKEALAKTIKK